MQYPFHATTQERAPACGVGCTVLMHGATSSADESRRNLRLEVVLTIESRCHLVVGRA
jgi:hypothetical protein